MSNINTLQAYDDLIAAGAEEKQARAYVNTLNDSLAGLATKEDLNLLEEKLETRLGASIDAVESRLGSKIDTLESKMESKIGTLRALGYAIFAALCLPILQNFFTWQSVLKHFAK